MSFARFLLVPLLAVVLYGCGSDPMGVDPSHTAELDFELATPGEQGRARFRLTECDPITGCDMARPLLQGHRDTVAVRLDAPADAAAPSLQLVSTDRAVLRVDGVERSADGDEYLVDIVAGRVGRAMLRLQTSEGVLVDRVPVRVAQAAGIEYSLSEERSLVAPGRIRLRVGQPAFLVGTPVSAAGERLHAFEEITWSVDGEDAAVVSAASVAPTGERLPSCVSLLRPLAPGEATILGQAGGAEVRITVQVVE